MVGLHNRVIYGDAKYSFDWCDAKALARYQDMTTEAGIDYDNTQAPLVVFSADQYAKVKTQELQLISNATSPGADWLQWIAGIYHIESGAGYPEVLFSVGRDQMGSASCRERVCQYV